VGAAPLEYVHSLHLMMQVLRKPDGGSRGFGFVTYKDEISVEKCLVMQHQLGGRTVELKRAIKKDDMSGGYGGGGAALPLGNFSFRSKIDLGRVTASRGGGLQLAIKKGNMLQEWEIMEGGGGLNTRFASVPTDMLWSVECYHIHVICAWTQDQVFRSRRMRGFYWTHSRRCSGAVEL